MSVHNDESSPQQPVPAAAAHQSPTASPEPHANTPDDNGGAATAATAADADLKTTPEADADASETLRSELAEIAQKADEYLRLAQRTQADFINYRRRVEEERELRARDANLAYILKLLPILDDFERAAANATPDELESNWGKGMQLVERNLRSLLAADDVQRVDPTGEEFDPRHHEAIAQQPTEGTPEGRVLHLVRPGYRKGDRIIRPAQVIVS